VPKEFKNYIVLKWFSIIAIISFLYFPLMHLWTGYRWELPLNIRVRPSANILYVILCIAIFLLVLTLWKKDFFLSLSEKPFLIISFFVTFLFHICLASTDKGFFYAITHSYLSTPYEYYADLPKIKGLGNFLRDYVSLMPSLSLHAHTHPPGGDVFLYLIKRFIGRGVFIASLISVLVSNLSIIPFYYSVKLFLGKKALRLATLIWLFTPAIAYYSAVCMDGVFMFFMLWPIYFILRFYVKGKNPLTGGILAGIALSLASFMTFSASYIILFYIILTGFCILKRRENAAGLFFYSLTTGIVLLFFYLALYYILGFNVLACLDEARAKDFVNYTPVFYSVKQYIYSRSANFIGYLAFMGFASSGIFCLFFSKKIRRLQMGNSELRAIIYAAVITMLEMNLGGLYNLETGRIWIYLSPLFIAPVAETINIISDSTGRNNFDTQLLCLIFIQTLIGEILFYTFW